MHVTSTRPTAGGRIDPIFVDKHTPIRSSANAATHLPVDQFEMPTETSLNPGQFQLSQLPLSTPHGYVGKVTTGASRHPPKRPYVERERARPGEGGP